MKALCVLALVGALAGTAAAQHDVDFSVERFTPSALPESYLQVEGAGVLPRRGLAFGVASSYSYRPLVLRDHDTGASISDPVHARVGVDLLAGIGLTERISLGLALPLVVRQTGTRVQAVFGGPPDPGATPAPEDQPLAAAALGDPRIELKALIGKPEGFRPRGSFALVVTLPLGKASQFAGESGVVIEPRLLVDWVRPRLGLALQVGARLRSKESQFFNKAVRDELVLGAAVKTPLSSLRAASDATARRYWLVGEVVGTVAAEGGALPWEARGGVRIAVTDLLDIGLGVGVGLGHEIGAPTVRGILDVRYGGAPHDADRDGVPDLRDRCPFEPEDRDGFQDADGCPDPDNDGDGIPDDEDQCPDVPGDFSRHGCPNLDHDGDGIPDAKDKCPYEAEDMDGFEDADGCPDLDNDKDGIPDVLDKCPNTPGDAAHEGCPPSPQPATPEPPATPEAPPPEAPPSGAGTPGTGPTGIYGWPVL